MRNYKDVFDTSSEIAEALGRDYSKVFPEWRSHPEIFHFIMANGSLLNTDLISLRMARNINITISDDFISKGPSENHSKFDGVESRHILMMTFLASILGRDWGRVVEIGGGYGNCARLASGIINFSSWTIIDLWHILLLQKWFLEKENIPLQNIYFDEIAVQADLVIAAHSLSEFDQVTFDQYLKDILNTTWLFYVSHNSDPSLELLQYKQNQIRKYFEEFTKAEYEGGNSTMYLFKRISPNEIN